MCKLSNTYILDMFTSDDSGAITFNVANSLPQIMNTPCKILVKSVQTELIKVTSAATPVTYDIDKYNFLRVAHNMNIQSGSNYTGFSNSSTLCFFDTFKARETSVPAGTTKRVILGSTDIQNTLFAPNGLPSILILNRRGATANLLSYVPTDGIVDTPYLSWSVRLEITVNPDQE